LRIHSRAFGRRITVFGDLTKRRADLRVTDHVTSGTWQTTAPNKSGRSTMLALTSRPPFEPPYAHLLGRGDATLDNISGHCLKMS